MAEIYLNPESAVSWASEGNEAEGQAAITAAVDEEAQEAIKAATTLLQQMRPADMESNRYKVWQQPPSHLMAGWSSMNGLPCLLASREAKLPSP